jgi:hypothetical protein
MAIAPPSFSFITYANSAYTIATSDLVALVSEALEELQRGVNGGQKA